MFDDSDGVSCE
ncbi:BnaA08g04040D [Brassica napus]|uniref:BnaA08g04040D protein n=1 Tax=Brassica napus TaxID=3708 RepID=A0A078FRF7_BRANA|nr:BnaA08g04040D [Brassica napus]